MGRNQGDQLGTANSMSTDEVMAFKQGKQYQLPPFYESITDPRMSGGKITVYEKSNHSTLERQINERLNQSQRISDLDKHVMEKVSSRTSIDCISNFSKNEEGGPIDRDLIMKGLEDRTNLMVKNIPCRYTEEQIRADFEQNHKNHFNYLHVPLDKH